MEVWIPFFQSLVWPIFIAILLFWFRGWFRELLEIVKKRIEGGSEMSVGPTGFTLGQAPKLEEPESETTPSPNQAIEQFNAEAKEAPPQKETALELSKYFRLAHEAAYDPELSRKQRSPYYRVRVWLEVSDPELISKVSKVVYHLHPTFPDPDREVTTKGNKFELQTYAWGEFNLSADVYFDDETQPLKLFRYLNF